MSRRRTREPSIDRDPDRFRFGGHRRPLQVVVLGIGVLFAIPASAATQSSATEEGMRLRFGVTVGGIGLVGLSFEFRWGNQSVDVNVATFSFDDVSVAVTGKQYFGGGDAQPFLGIGLWGVTAFSQEVGRNTGMSLLLRMPVGVDWNFTGKQSFGGSIAVNQGLWIRRADPQDDTPIRRRPVPLPGVYFRTSR